MADVEVIFRTPTKESKGFLARSKKALKFMGTIKQSDEVTLEKLLAIEEFLADFIEQPTDHDAKIEAMDTMSENEFYLMLNAVVGGKKNDDTDPLSKMNA